MTGTICSATTLTDLVGICGPEAVFAALKLAELTERYGLNAVTEETLHILRLDGWLTDG